jgi:hypothetical protein
VAEIEKAGQFARPFSSDRQTADQETRFVWTGKPTNVFSSTFITIFPSDS